MWFGEGILLIRSLLSLPGVYLNYSQCLQTLSNISWEKITFRGWEPLAKSSQRSKAFIPVATFPLFLCYWRWYIALSILNQVIFVTCSQKHPHLIQEIIFLCLYYCFSAPILKNFLLPPFTLLLLALAQVPVYPEALESQFCHPND